jgi:hypothetical protein
MDQFSNLFRDLFHVICQINSTHIYDLLLKGCVFFSSSVVFRSFIQIFIVKDTLISNFL